MIPLKENQTQEDALKEMIKERLKYRNSLDSHKKEWARIGIKQAIQLLKLNNRS